MTSKLEKYLSKELYTRFGHLYIRQNYRPDWMEGLELDFYIDEFKLAAEVQGEQHYKLIEFFHNTLEGFEKQQKRDEKKLIICRERKIKLIEIFTEKDADIFIQLVKEKCRPFLKYDQLEEEKPKIISNNISRKSSPLAYINQFCHKVKTSGMKAYEKQIEEVSSVASRLNPSLDINRIAINELEETIKNIKGIIPPHTKRNKR